jgi:hypothetical protein
VADPLRVHVVERLQRLVQVDAHVVDGETLPLPLKAQGDRPDGVWQKVHDEVQVGLIPLAPTARAHVEPRAAVSTKKTSERTAAAG